MENCKKKFWINFHPTEFLWDTHFHRIEKQIEFQTSCFATTISKKKFKKYDVTIKSHNVYLEEGSKEEV